MKYDATKYRALGVGERVEDGDCYLTPFDIETGAGPNLCESMIGAIVSQDDDWTFLRPLDAQQNPWEVTSARKDIPVASGVLDYFPDAIMAVAVCSKRGSVQHHPGKPMHWDRAKSGDEPDALIRHFIERGTVDSDGVLHSTKVAWRALAMLQKELEGIK